MQFLSPASKPLATWPRELWKKLEQGKDSLAKCLGASIVSIVLTIGTTFIPAITSGIVVITPLQSLVVKTLAGEVCWVTIPVLLRTNHINLSTF